MVDRPGDARAALAPWPAQEHGERLSPTAQQGAGQIQVFGRRASRDTHKALRFFSERRIAVSFVDLAIKQMAPTELRRFSSRLTVRALLDERARAYSELGLAYMRLSDEDVFERVLGNQALIRLPLVRSGTDVSVGYDETAWKSWLKARRSDEP
ncbi:MAG TPA: ArsC/Spx/MgsR family protein [Candidatus Limnocylindrales bacterium]